MLDIGPLFLIALDGKTLTPEEKEAISLFGLRHFIFFSRNLGSYGETRALLEELETLAGKGLRAIDQEGGPVSRLKPPHFPGLKAPLSLASEEDPEEAVAREAVLCARELKRWGFNFNLAPVLDLGEETAPSFLKGRTFGGDPQMVAGLARVYIRAFLDEGLLCCAKHFPGLGGVEVDPHQGLPVKETVEEEDLLPFLEAIRIGVPAVMTTHLLIPAWDKEPATFSPKIVKFLRENLGFKGLILTDDLFMGGALARASLEEAVLRAFLAGHDLLLLCGEFHKSIDALAIFSEECQKSLILRKKVGERLSFIEKQLHPSI
ncbi:MAG: glycoside hydrolase family 3 protein [Thermodesulfobacteria bacterium]|nr:glycoside hydrolase family 3 protein [Thermodesulfobacteriota bacterium]